MTTTEIKQELSQFNGTDNYYTHLFGIVYTDGIRYLAEECQCYWLIDLVASYQSEQDVKKEEFQVYKLRVNSDKSAVVEISDGNDNIITTLYKKETLDIFLPGQYQFPSKRQSKVFLLDYLGQN